MGSKLPGLGILGDLVCDRGQGSPSMSMPAGKAGEEGVLRPCCTLLAGSSRDSWSGSFLETSDSPVLRGAIPRSMSLSSTQPIVSVMGSGTSTCPQPLPVPPACLQQSHRSL